MSDEPTRVRKAPMLASKWQQTAPLRAISKAFRATTARFNVGFVTPASRRVFSPAQRERLATRARPEEFLRQNRCAGPDSARCTMSDEPTRVRTGSNLASNWPQSAPLRVISAAFRASISNLKHCSRHRNRSPRHFRRRNAKRSTSGSSGKTMRCTEPAPLHHV